MIDYRKRAERQNELYAQFRKDDAEQMLADFKELMQLGPFRRVLVAMTRRAYLEKSIPDAESAYLNGKWVGYREFAVQLAESAKAADFAMWQKAEAERREIEEDRKVRVDLAVNETKGN